MKTSELADKDHYSELTDKQQTVIDYLAENPDATYMEASREIEPHDSYIGGVAKKYSDILEEREATMDNDHMNTHADGRIKTQGEIDLTDEQTIDERPVKTTQDAATDGGPENDTTDVTVVTLDGALADRLEAIGSEVTPDWMDSDASPKETVRYLARMYHGEVSQ
jgi:hypothetical protein